MVSTVTNPGTRLAGMLSDLGHKLKVGNLTEDELALFLKRQNPFGSAPSLASKHAKKAAPLNTIIRVDRAVRVIYPDFTTEVMHPELETVGPAEYDLAKVELYLHENQKNGNWMRSDALYAHLKETGSLKNCLGLQDALEIQALGIKVFRKLFGGEYKFVFFWKSVVRESDGNLNAPYLYEGGGQVLLGWDRFDDEINDRFRALCFASQP